MRLKEPPSTKNLTATTVPQQSPSLDRPSTVFSATPVFPLPAMWSDGVSVAPEGVARCLCQEARMVSLSLLCLSAPLLSDPPDAGLALDGVPRYVSAEAWVVCRA